MFPTTALAANIDVSGKVTVDRVYEEPTCADNLYYGEVNVNGSATESKTRLTHTVLPLIQWQYGNNTYQIIPSAYKYYVCNINDPNNILEGIEGSEGSSTLSGWPGTYKCYQTVVTTDGVTNGTATFDIDLAYQFSRLNSSIGWNYTSNWGGRTLHFTITQTVDESTTYTVTYTDGVEDEEVFADDVHENLSSGVATPAFSGGTPTRTGYVFKGWNPEVAATVTGNATYVATWGEDKNNNGIDDNEETKYTVTYTDGVDGEEVFADQVYGNLLSGVATPAFEGTPTREEYVFKGWEPAVAEKPQPSRLRSPLHRARRPASPHYRGQYPHSLGAESAGPAIPARPGGRSARGLGRNPPRRGLARASFTASGNRAECFHHRLLDGSGRSLCRY